MSVYECQAWSRSLCLLPSCPLPLSIPHPSLSSYLSFMSLAPWLSLLFHSAISICHMFVILFPHQVVCPSLSIRVFPVLFCLLCFVFNFASPVSSVTFMLAVFSPVACSLINPSVFILSASPSSLRSVYSACLLSSHF